MDIQRQLLMGSSHESVIKAAQQLCSSNDSELLYLTVFGSELYGTSTDQSDLDVRGLFLPSLQSKILGDNQKSLHYSTGRNESRNSANDVDIDLWALDYWLLNLLPSGDTGALDLLFSPSHSKCVIMKSPLLEPIFAHPQKLLNLAGNSKYVEYSLSQAKKYGIKGSRLGALRRVWKWLAANSAEGRLLEHLEGIIGSCGDDKYCFSKLLPDGPALVLCGKIHVGTIGMKEFRARIGRDMERFGERAKAAEANQGVDYKALSHAMRALDQMEELLTTGRIKYPLKNWEELTKIKNGAIPWIELEPLILKRLEEIDCLYKKLSGDFGYDWSFAKKFLLECYGFGVPICDTPFKDIAKKELATIEDEYQVKILYAAEAGSRAWGFPSLDSDYDIRFIYIHPKEWYLGAAPERQRNVIEKAVPTSAFGLLDFSGWELRKALKILQSGNPQLGEWLLSPIIYEEKTDFAVICRSCLPHCLSMGGMWHHYYGLVKSAYKTLSSGNQSAKALLYVIRPLLVLLWLEKGLGIPPVAMPELIEKTIDEVDFKMTIKALIERKMYIQERDAPPSAMKIRKWITSECEKRSCAFPLLDYKRELVDMDTFFRKILEQSLTIS